MTRCGIGPKFTIPVFIYGLIAGSLTHLYPDKLLIRCIPFEFLFTSGLILTIAGIIIYINTLRIFSNGYCNKSLVTEGAFSVVRHPIYAAWILLIFPGIALSSCSWPMLIIPLIAYIGFKTLIHKEDRDLENRFSKQYLEYRSKVDEFFPFCSKIHQICNCNNNG